MTAILFFRKLRLKLFEEPKEPQKKIRAGSGAVVQVDECYLSSGEGGRRVARQGRGLAGKIALVGAREYPSGKIRIERVHSTNEETLCGFIERNVESRAAVIHTDSFRAYNGLRRRGFRHFTVNHFLRFKDFRTGACTNHIEAAWSFLKRHLSRFCGGWRNNLNLWIAEIEYRIENNYKKLHKTLIKQI